MRQFQLKNFSVTVHSDAQLGPAEAEPPALLDAAEASREPEALEKEARKDHLSSSEVVEAADALRARYGL